MLRMPPRTQRRNTAYLNRQIPRSGQLDRDLEDQATDSLTGLAIDLGGSIKLRLRLDDPSAAYLDQPLHLIAPRERSANTK